MASLIGASIPIPVNPDSGKSNLKPFPIIKAPADQSGHTGKIVRQIRIKNLTPKGSTEIPITFMNTYGFIKPIWTHGEFFSEFHRNNSTPSLTACMLPFGTGPFVDNPSKLLGDLEKIQINVKKSASLREEVIFDIKTIPFAFTKFQIGRERIICVSSDRYVKCPGKLTSGVEYSYCIAFISLTFCPESYKFRVARPLQQLRTSYMRAIQLEIIMKIDCAPDSPIKRNLIYDKENDIYIASVWLHLCNILKGKNHFKTYDDTYFANKCRKMQLVCGIADMWGPTIIVHSKGRIPKSAAPYFNSKGWACHPLSEIAPSITKILWSVGATILQVNAVLQPSDISSAAGTSDLIYPKVKINPDLAEERGIKWNPLRKAVHST
ncbi:matrix protein [Tuhoko virus 1]|uniref:Matrix protein n=1 Tax=Tuhoko virus 1 TaxID=798072 RepID=D8WJ25_9MONO|nr:matrix protein [Tuhoko virus 1]ADI80712.1 matrix protein [Tuhoko virus 1]